MQDGSRLYQKNPKTIQRYLSKNNNHIIQIKDQNDTKNNFELDHIQDILDRIEDDY